MEKLAKQFLENIQGEDPERGGLKDTPKRMAKAWQEWFDGYQQKPSDIIKKFEDGAESYKTYDELVIIKNIPFFSHCEHHVAVFFGHVSIGYIPNKEIIGLSKISRLVDIFAHRLQVQERLTQQIADCLEENLVPKGVSVIIKAEHTCMITRGVKIAGSQTTTSAMRGVFLEKDNNARLEFLQLISS